jgi:sarcosine oxidase
LTGVADTPSVAIIGAGIVGLSAGYALKERGILPTLYERGEPGAGQSGGEGRIFRHFHSDPRLVRLAIKSRGIWDEWQQHFGEELVSREGVVAIGPAATEHLAVLQSVGVVGAWEMTSDEVAQRLPMLAWYEGPAVLDAGGGAIRVRTAIRVLLGELREQIVPDEVLSVRPLDDGRVEVRTGGEVAIYDRVIVCAGQGNGLLTRGLDLAVPVAAAAHVRLTYDVRGDAPERCACLQDGSGTWGETAVYASPKPGNRQYSVGIAEAMEVRPDGGVIYPAGLDEITQRINEYVSRALPGLDPEPALLRHCWVTELPWSDDGLGIWESGGALLVSGHNLFKHAPALGRHLASAILDGPPTTDLSPEAKIGSPEARRTARTGAD